MMMVMVMVQGEAGGSGEKTTRPRAHYLMEESTMKGIDDPTQKEKRKESFDASISSARLCTVNNLFSFCNSNMR